MGFMGLVEFSLQCFDVLAWPLLALVYPLCLSIRAIEANSISDSQKLNTYWVAFSLILLFEHAFMNLLGWLSLWPYIRLVIVFWLVIPHFDGAFYVYKHLICPCKSVDIQIVINWFNRRKESLFKKENFLAEVERYIEENGPEALEKIVASKSGRIKSNSDVIEFNAVPSMENKEVSQAEPNVSWTEKGKFEIMGIKEKAIGVSADTEILETPPSKKVQQSTCAISHATTQSDTSFSSHRLTQIENSTFAAVETKEKTVEVATGPGREVLESSKIVQREWTCALCQLTTESEATLNSHLQGSKHKAACEALKAKSQLFAPKIAPSSTVKEPNRPNEEPGKFTTSSTSRQKVIVHENVQGQKVWIPASLTKNPDISKEPHPTEEPGKITMSSTSRQKVIIHENMQGQKIWVPASLTKNSDMSKEPRPTEEPEKITMSSTSRQKVIIHENVQGQKIWVPASLTKNSDISKEEPAEGAPSNGTKCKVTNLTLWCNICNVHCTSENDMASHLNGRKHQEKMQEWQQNPN